MTKEDKRQKLEAEKARYREQTQEGKKLTEQEEKYKGHDLQHKLDTDPEFRADFSKQIEDCIDSLEKKYNGLELERKLDTDPEFRAEFSRDIDSMLAKLTEKAKLALYGEPLSKEEIMRLMEENRQQKEKEMELFKNPISKEVVEYYLRLHAERKKREKENPRDEKLYQAQCKKTDKMWAEINRNQGK